MPVSEDYMRSKDESRRRKSSTHSADQAKRESTVLDLASLGSLVDGPKELGIVFSSERASLYETAFDDTYRPPSPQSANFMLPNRQSRSSSMADHAVRSKASSSPASSEKFDKLENELRFLREQIARASCRPRTRARRRAYGRHPTGSPSTTSNTTSAPCDASWLSIASSGAINTCLCARTAVYGRCSQGSRQSKVAQDEECVCYCVLASCLSIDFALL